MAKAAAGTLEQNRSLGHSGEWAKQAAIIVSASLFVALCARVSVPLPFTPVPLTLQNFAVILVGLLLGSRRGFAALALYLAEGAAGLPVFSLLVSPPPRRSTAPLLPNCSPERSRWR